MEKFYVYVDESGQDTRGILFIVAVIIIDKDRDEVERECIDAEKVSGKGNIKWRGARYNRRIEFVRLIFQKSIFQNKLNAVIYENKGTDFLQLTAQAISTVVSSIAPNQPYQATVSIDGLPRSKQKPVGAILRRLGVKVRKVRGVKKDENNPFIRLADTVAGLVRAAHGGRTAEASLLRLGKNRGILKEIVG
jgi:hypothetical protein